MRALTYVCDVKPTATVLGTLNVTADVSSCELMNETLRPHLSVTSMNRKRCDGDAGAFRGVCGGNLEGSFGAVAG